MSKLTPPAGKRDHILGKNDAPVILIEYGDFECPFCGEAFPIVKKVLKKEGNYVSFIYRYFPLGEAHPHAINAAKAAEAAGLQSRFWEMHDLLFENQEALEDEDLLEYAEKLDLDIEKFALDSESKKVEERVEEDFISGVKSGVNGTPTFFINGKRFEGVREFKDLTSAIHEMEEREIVV